MKSENAGFVTMVSPCGMRRDSNRSLLTCEAVSIAHSNRGTRDFSNSENSTFRAREGRNRALDGVAPRVSIPPGRDARRRNLGFCRVTTMVTRSVLAATGALAQEHRGIERIVTAIATIGSDVEGCRFVEPSILADVASFLEASRLYITPGPRGPVTNGAGYSLSNVGACAARSCIGRT